MALDPLPQSTERRAAVRQMFDRIAPRYDRLNRLLTFGLDRSWRRRALDAIAVGTGDTVLDLACGTGDLCELARARGARVIGIDFAREMLRGAMRRGVHGSFVQGDAAALPLADACCDALLCGFALRNFVSLADVAVEMARVLVPGGRIALIEVDRPRSRLPRAGHSLYFDRVVPRVGGWLSDREAYAYLPRSTVHLPAQPDLFALLQSAGFTELRKLRLLLGSAQIITGVRT